MSIMSKRNIIAFLVALGVMVAWDGAKLVRKVMHNYTAITTMIKDGQWAPTVDRSKIPHDLQVW